MTEPQTPTGEAILHYGQQSEASMSPKEWRAWWKPRILAIEAEAARQERERLGRDVRGHHVRSHSGDFDSCVRPVCNGWLLLERTRFLLAEETTGEKAWAWRGPEMLRRLLGPEETP